MSKGKKGKTDILSHGVVTRNKAARHKFEILDTFEAGMALIGSEVKAMRVREASLQDAFCFIRNDEMWLLKAYIPPYEYAGIGSHETYRQRKLLLHKREIRRLKEKVSDSGMTIIPLEIYFNDRGIAKCKIALARGKRIHDKRETLKKRDAEREMRQVKP